MKPLKKIFAVIFLLMIYFYSKNEAAVNHNYILSIFQKDTVQDSNDSTLIGIKEITALPLYPDNNENKNEKIIRVHLKTLDSKLELSSLYCFYMKNLDNQKIYEINTGKFFIWNKDNITIDNISSIKGFEILPYHDTLISVNKRKYRGKIFIYNSPDGMIVVNYIPMEKYLYGVVSREIPTSWAIEALKAQAVAARSYVLYRCMENSKNSKKFYDIKSTATAQQYWGYDFETQKVRSAVDLTKNIVLTYGKKHKRLVAAYYHSNSGGYTIDDIYIWNAGFEKPYLKEIEDKFSLSTPNNQWKYIFSADRIQKILKRYYPEIKEIENISPNKLSKFGRVLELLIKHKNGSILINSETFRNRLGAFKIRSTLFKIEMIDNKFIFTGKGFGHGVGMSQWGIKKMADSGYKYKDILKYYYINTELNIYKNNLCL